MTKLIINRKIIRKALLVFALIVIPLEMLSVCGCLGHCELIEKLTHLITACGSMSGIGAHLIEIPKALKE